MNNKLTIEVNGNRGAPIIRNLSDLLSFEKKNASKLAGCYQRFINKYKNGGDHTNLQVTLNSFGRFYVGRTTNLMNAKELYILIFDFRHHYYTNKQSKASLGGRNDRWMRFILFLKFCSKEGVIAEIAFPSGNTKLSNKKLLRESTRAAAAKSSDPFDSKTVVSIDLSRTDAEYLDDVRAEYGKSYDALLDCALSEIYHAESMMNKGIELASTVDFDEINNGIESTKNHKKIPYKDPNNTVGFFSRHHPSFAPNVLNRIFRKHDGLIFGLKKFGLDGTHDDALTKGSLSISDLSAYVGQATVRSLIPFLVYMLLKNPSFRISTLLDMSFTSKNGASKMLASAGENGDSLRAKTAKHRAHSEKHRVQDETDIRVLNILTRLTSSSRKHLRHINDPDQDRLWVGTTQHNAPHWLKGAQMRAAFTGVKKDNFAASFLTSHERLAKHLGSLQLKNIGPTSAIIHWLDSDGDTHAAASMLGNTMKMSMDNYIPKQLQDLMNERVIRRFQNLLICTAMSGSDLMLKASDFKTIEQLHKFLAQMFELPEDGRPSSDIEKQFKSRMGGAQKDQDKSAGGATAIKVAISKENLKLLFSYEAHIEKSGIDLRQPKGRTKNRDDIVFWNDIAKSLHATLPKSAYGREYASMYEQVISELPLYREAIKLPELTNE
jgi:hypothetical protein